MSSPDEVQRYFQEDPQFAAQAATYLYFGDSVLTISISWLSRTRSGLPNQFW